MIHRNLTCVVLFCSFASTSCSTSDTDSGTTGRNISLKTRVDVDGDLSKPWTNVLGWEISLSKAYLSVGALYYYSGDPLLSKRSRPNNAFYDAWAWAGEFFVSTAHAHPGHYIEGAAMGQMLTPTTVELLRGSVSLADGEGVTGATNSARITWQSPPQGKLAGELDGNVVLTRGTATRDGVTIDFIAKATAAEVVDGNGKAEVAGCAFGSKPGEVGVDMDDDGTVTLILVPRVWFDQVDFDYVVPGAEGAPMPDEDGRVDLDGTLAWAGFLRGVKKGTAYEFSYTK